MIWLHPRLAASHAVSLLLLGAICFLSRDSIDIAGFLADTTVLVRGCMRTTFESLRGSQNVAIIVSCRLQPTYNQKARYPPNQWKCGFFKFFIIKALGESVFFVTDSMNLQNALTSVKKIEHNNSVMIRLDRPQFTLLSIFRAC